jgi:hypothetical protein
MENQTIRWWEKTVEYAFIQKHVQLEAMIAPLDGDEERAGDAIFSQEGLWSLIEFKKDKAAIGDEKLKYENFYSAKAELKNSDRHHVIIYGAEEKRQLVLRARTYFSELDVTMDEIDGCCTTLELFRSYLESLLYFKKKPKGAGSGSFGSIVVVNRTGRRVSCLSMQEFEVGMGMHIDKDVDGPSI